MPATTPLTPAPAVQPAAGLLRRLAAMGYDCLVLFGVLFIATGLYQQVFGWLVEPTANVVVSTGEVIHQLPQTASGPLYQLYLALVIYGFFALFWHRSGQTLGMVAWRLQIQDCHGGSPSWEQTLLRFAGACISAICLGAGYWWMLVDRERRTWHDRWSNTRVVQLPKPAIK